MIRYLLDTSVVSLPMNSHSSETMRGRYNRIESQSAISATTVSELRFGILKLPLGKRRTGLAAYLDNLLDTRIEVLPFDQQAAEWHASERARLASVGQTPPFADGQIAAVAAVHGLTIVTFNPRDFERFNGVVIEAWA